MAHSNKFFKIISNLFPFADFLHILQLETYFSGRYLKRLKYLFYRRDLQRLEKLTWTTRAKLTLALSIVLTILGIALVGQSYLFALLLLFYFLYNPSGPSVLWKLLLATGFIINVALPIIYIFWPVVIIPAISDILSLGVLALIGLLSVFVAFQNRSSLPKSSKFVWFTLFLVYVSFALIPLENITLEITRIVILLITFSIILIPFWIALANWILSPVYYLSRLNLYNRAKNTLRQKHKDLKIIVVAGSYGKTTTKNFIRQLTHYNYRLQMVPGNTNTAVGVSGWILKNLETSTEILLVESDGYDGREYSHIGRTLQPDTVVLTNVGDQHLERFGTRRNLAKAMLKLAKSIKTSGRVIMSFLTAEDLECWDMPYTKVLADQQVQVVQLDEPIKYEGKKLKVDKLSVSNQTNLRFALKVAKSLEIPADFVQDTVKTLELPERRQQEIELFGFQVLDDSYNVSYTTAQAGLAEAAKRAKELKKKLVVVTGGIPELGQENESANVDIAKMLAKKAQTVVLLQTILAKDVQKGLEQVSFENIHIAARMTNAWELIQEKFDPKTHYVLMQPELTDLYYEV